MPLSFLGRLLPKVLASLLLVLTVTAHATTPEEKAGARAAALSGVQAFDDGRYGEAVDYFTRAESIVHAPPHLLYIARAEVELGHFVRAREAYLKIVHEEIDETAPRAFQDAQQQARRELPLLEPRIPAVIVTVTAPEGAPVELFRDDVKLPAALLGIAIPTDPGSHEFRASAPGYADSSTRVTLSEGQQQTIELRLSKVAVVAPPPMDSTKAPTAEQESDDVRSGPNGTQRSKLKILGYTGLALGVGGISAGTYFLLDAAGTRKKSNALYDACPALPDGTRDCSDDDRDEIVQLDKDAKLPNTVGIVALSVGTAVLATGITLLVYGYKKDPAAQSSAPQVWPIMGWGSVGMAGTF